jgi:hypothetical protein
MMREPPLHPPGWGCDEDAKQYWRLGGYHFEEDKSLDRIAAHDVTPTLKARQKDINTAHGWRLLDNKERREILGGKANIYDFVEFKEPK